MELRTRSNAPLFGHPVTTSTHVQCVERLDGVTRSRVPLAVDGDRRSPAAGWVRRSFSSTVVAEAAGVLRGTVEDAPGNCDHADPGRARRSGVGVLERLPPRLEDESSVAHQLLLLRRWSAPTASVPTRWHWAGSNEAVPAAAAVKDGP